MRGDYIQREFCTGPENFRGKAIGVDVICKSGTPYRVVCDHLDDGLCYRGVTEQDEKNAWEASAKPLDHFLEGFFEGFAKETGGNFSGFLYKRNEKRGKLASEILKREAGVCKYSASQEDRGKNYGKGPELITKGNVVIPEEKKKESYLSTSTHDRASTVETPISNNSRAIISLPKEGEIKYVEELGGVPIGNLFSKEYLMEKSPESGIYSFETRYLTGKGKELVKGLQNIELTHSDLNGLFKDLVKKYSGKVGDPNNIMDILNIFAEEMVRTGKFKTKKVYASPDDVLKAAHGILIGDGYKGDCSTATRLFNNFSRALGLPARTSIYRMPEGKYPVHLGSEVQVPTEKGKMWVRADPSPDIKHKNPFISLDMPYNEIWVMPIAGGKKSKVPLIIDSI